MLATVKLNATNRTIASQVNIINYFRLTGIVAKIAKNNKPYWVLKLANNHDEITAYLFNQTNAFEQLYHGVLLKCHLKEQSYLKRPYWALEDFQIITRDEIEQTPSNFCFPVSFCNNKTLLARFYKVVEQIKEKSLTHFIAQVLLPPDVCIKFLLAPASLNYHHNYVGGLLEHSVQVAEIVASLPFKSKYNRDIAIVGALFHDIGKIKTLSPQMKRLEQGKWVSHEALTLEICSYALLNLERVNADVANQLRHCWTCASPGARYGYKAATDIAVAVQAADRVSAQL